MTKKKAVFIGAGATGVFILALVAYFLVNAIAGQLTVEHAGGTIISTESSRSSQPLNQPSNPTGQENQSKAQQYSNEAESPGTTTGIPSTGQPNNPNNQPFTNVFFQSRESNPFIDTDEDRLSTFALDGDTASFEIAREWLKSTGTIDHSSVRPEEWINSAPQGYARSTDGRVSIQLDGSRSLFPERYSPTQNTLYHTLRVGIVMPRQPDQRPPVSAVFVIDGSSSMEQHIVDDPDQNTSMTLFDAGIKAIQEVMDHLQPGDEAAVVLYEETARVVSDWEPHNNLNIVHRKLNQLTTGGSTYAADGITKAYALAESRLEQRDVKIIIISDGVANRGATSSGGIFELVEDYAKRNTVVHTVGVGIFGKLQRRTDGGPGQQRERVLSIHQQRQGTERVRLSARPTCSSCPPSATPGSKWTSTPKPSASTGSSATKTAPSPTPTSGSIPSTSANPPRPTRRHRPVRATHPRGRRPRRRPGHRARPLPAP